jgi:hypothetical protein
LVEITEVGICGGLFLIEIYYGIAWLSWHLYFCFLCTLYKHYSVRTVWLGSAAHPETTVIYGVITIQREPKSEKGKINAQRLISQDSRWFERPSHHTVDTHTKLEIQKLTIMNHANNLVTNKNGHRSGTAIVPH